MSSKRLRAAGNGRYVDIDWMDANQLGRRNLSPAWKVELELCNKADLLEIGKVNLRLPTGGKNKTTLSQNDKVTQPVNTRIEIAKAAGVSTGQVGMAEQVKKKDPALWEQAKSGEVSISSAYKTIKKKEQLEGVSGG